MKNQGYCDHKKVEQIGRMNITGNIIPMNWYKTITRDNGKPDQTAISILGVIVFWYQRFGSCDDSSSDMQWLKKKITNDGYLRTSYPELADIFGFGCDETKEAIGRLESLGVIKCILNQTSRRSLYASALVLDINPERLTELTYNRPEDQTKASTDN